MKSLSIQRIGSIVIVCLVLCWAATGWAAEKGAKGQGPDLDVLQATIEKKNLEKITTNTGERFALSENTIIVDTDGQQVSVRQMLVPCDAQIGYRIEKGVRLAERIDILRVSASANRHLRSDRPE